MDKQLSEKTSFITVKDEINIKKIVILIVTSVIFLASIYIARLFHLLEEPLFSLIYYGNLNGVFYAACSFLFYLAVVIVTNIILKKKFKFRLFEKNKKPISIVNRAIIYIIVLGFGLGISIYLNFKLKIVYELGERITGMQLLSNGVSYVMEAMKILIAVCIICLIQETFENIFESKIPIPYGGLVLFLTYGVLEFIFNYSTFSPIYFVFTFVYGIIYLLTNKRTLLTFLVSLILFLL